MATQKQIDLGKKEFNIDFTDFSTAEASKAIDRLFLGKAFRKGKDSGLKVGDMVEDKFKTENSRRGTVVKVVPPRSITVKWDGETKLKCVSILSLHKVD